MKKTVKKATKRIRKATYKVNPAFSKTDVKAINNQPKVEKSLTVVKQPANKRITIHANYTLSPAQIRGLKMATNKLIENLVTQAATDRTLDDQFVEDLAISKMFFKNALSLYQNAANCEDVDAEIRRGISKQYYGKN